MDNSKKILIVKIGAIGDVVMATAMINAIDKKYPGAEITWLCGKMVEPLLMSFPRINRIISLDEKKLLTGNIVQKLSEILRTWIKLLFKKYDLIIVPYRDSRYKILTWLCFGSVRKDMNGTGRHNLFVPGRYHSVEYAKLILGNDDWRAEETGFPEIVVSPNQVIDNALNNLKGKKIVLNPGGGKNLLNPDEIRRWSVELYRELADRLIKQDCEIILIGAGYDTWILDHFKEIRCIDLIGKTSLVDLVYLFKNSDILVSHDTGAFHLAKLTPIKIIGLFGPVNPNERKGVKENVTIITADNPLPCSPCYDGKKFADCGNNICMKNISVNLVYDRVMRSILADKNIS